MDLFADERFEDYLRNNITELQQKINIKEMLLPLANVLTPSTLERLRRHVNNDSDSDTLPEFISDLSKRDNWVRHLIRALRHCKLNSLAAEYERVYNSYLISPTRNSHSLPPYAPPAAYSNRQPPLPQPDVLQHRSLQPQQDPPYSHPQPGRSQSLPQFRPDQEATWNHPSQNNIESPARPAPSPPSAPPSQSAMANPPEIRAPEDLDKSFNLPVPETNPVQVLPPESRDQALSEPQTPQPSIPSARNQERAEDLSGQSAHHKVAETFIPHSPGAPVNSHYTESYASPHHDPPGPVQPQTPQPSIPSARNQDRAEDLGGQSRYHKAVTPAVSPPSAGNAHSLRKDGEEQRREQTVYEQVVNPPGLHFSAANSSSVTQNVGVRDERRDQPVLPEVVNPPGLHFSAANSSSVTQNIREREERRNHPFLPEAAKPPVPLPPVREDSGNAPQNREPLLGGEVVNPPGLHFSAANSSSVTQNVGVREERRDQPVLPESSGRLLYNEAEFLSKPETLVSTIGVTREAIMQSTLTTIPPFEISIDGNETEARASNGASSSLRPPQSTTARGNAAISQPSTSTPRNHGTRQHSRSPEENDFTFEHKEPAEDSYVMSRELSDYKLQYSEEPPVDLLQGNNAMPRHRQVRIPNTGDTKDLNESQTSNKKEEDNKLKMALMALAAGVVCLSVFLLWKKHRS